MGNDYTYLSQTFFRHAISIYQRLELTFWLSKIFSYTGEPFLLAGAICLRGFKFHINEDVRENRRPVECFQFFIS